SVAGLMHHGSGAGRASWRRSPAACCRRRGSACTAVAIGAYRFAAAGRTCCRSNGPACTAVAIGAYRFAAAGRTCCRSNGPACTAVRRAYAAGARAPRRGATVCRGRVAAGGGPGCRCATAIRGTGCGTYGRRIGYARGARRLAGVAVYFGAVIADGALVYRCPARTGRAVDFPYRHPAARRAFDLAAARSAHVRTVIIHIRVIDDGGAVVYTLAVAVRCIIAVYPRAGNVALRYEHPVVMRDSDMHVDAHTRTQGCPAIVATSAPPAHPRRTPLISGYPRPAVVVAVRPPAVME